MGRGHRVTACAGMGHAKDAPLLRPRGMLPPPAAPSPPRLPPVLPGSLQSCPAPPEPPAAPAAPAAPAPPPGIPLCEAVGIHFAQFGREVPLHPAPAP